MALLKFISLSVGSLLLLQGAYGDDAVPAEGCVDQINKARKAAGLKDFAEVEDKLLPTKADAICPFLKAKTPGILPDDQYKGTAVVAYTPNVEDCTAAIEEWKKGFSIVSANKALPIAYETDDSNGGKPKAPYNQLEAVNFVALYSIKGKQAECAVVTCDTKKTLVCATTPSTFENKVQPFTEADWKGILSVHAPDSTKPSSATTAVPTVLALAAAAVGVALI